MPVWDGVESPIGLVAALKRQEMTNYAQEMMDKVYRYVLPLMRKRKYRVHKLVEFLPKNPNLLGLNVNHGQRISLRLRYHHNPREFLPFESILGTMLHELCHNTFGPHNASFFKLLDELSKELEDMMALGFRGDVFYGSGQRLNTPPRGTSPPLLQSRASSEPFRGKRMLGRGRKLGGPSNRISRPTRATLRDLILSAAERRRDADRVCKITNSVEDLPSDENGEVIDLTDDIQDPTKDLKDSGDSGDLEVIWISDED